MAEGRPWHSLVFSYTLIRLSLASWALRKYNLLIHPLFPSSFPFLLPFSQLATLTTSLHSIIWSLLWISPYSLLSSALTFLSFSPSASLQPSPPPLTPLYGRYSGFPHILSSALPILCSHSLKGPRFITTYVRAFLSQFRTGPLGWYKR